MTDSGRLPPRQWDIYLRFAGVADIFVMLGLGCGRSVSLSGRVLGVRRRFSSGRRCVSSSSVFRRCCGARPRPTSWSRFGSRRARQWRAATSDFKMGYVLLGRRARVLVSPACYFTLLKRWADRRRSRRFTCSSRDTRRLIDIESIRSMFAAHGRGADDAACSSTMDALTGR